MNLHIKKTKDDCKLEDRFQKKAISGLHICEIADKKTAYNEGRLYWISKMLGMRSTRLKLHAYNFLIEKLMENQLKIAKQSYKLQTFDETQL